QPAAVGRKKCLLHVWPEVLCKFAVSRRRFERMQMHGRPGPRHDRSLASIRTKLERVTVQSDVEGPLHFLCVPTNQLALPTSSDQVAAIRAENGQRRLRLVTTEDLCVTGSGVHPVDRA